MAAAFLSGQPHLRSARDERPVTLPRHCRAPIAFPPCSGGSSDIRRSLTMTTSKYWRASTRAAEHRAFWVSRDAPRSPRNCPRLMMIELRAEVLSWLPSPFGENLVPLLSAQVRFLFEPIDLRMARGLPSYSRQTAQRLA